MPVGFEGLVTLVEVLRSERGCPWDREQTPEEIKTYLLEEAYEVLEALDSGSRGDVRSELGDLLFHIVFLARIFEEEGDFNMQDVVETITAKMVRRHPHVFGQAQVSGSDEVRQRWHEIKMAEAKEKEIVQYAALDSVPHSLPALMRAYRVGERAARLGVDWPDVQSLVNRLYEGLADLNASTKKTGDERASELLGDFLFAAVNLGRFMRVHPETALIKTVGKFIERFETVEQVLKRQGRTLESASTEEIRAIWEECQTEQPVS